MASIHFKRKHHLSRMQVKAKVEEFAKDLQGKLGAEYHWEGDRLCFHRKGASGFINLGQGEVEVSVKLGLVLWPMKHKIETSIKEGFETALVESDDSKSA